jgi:AraC-like DNA-binding protein
MTREELRHTPRMDPAPPSPAPDPLGEALHFLRMDGGFYCRSELSAPWGMTLHPMPGYLWFHVATTGAALVEVDDENSRWLHPGDVTLVPHGNGHALRSEPGVPAPGILDLNLEHPSDRYEILRAGDGGTPTTLFCGGVRFDHPVARNLVGILPRMIHIQGSDGPRASRMHRAFELMAAEAREFQAGGEAVITRLADVLVIQAIRSWIETAPAARGGWLGALQDQQIGRALALIHQDPAREWTVASLAGELALSRSAFSARFTELVGEPVMQYVTRWRMQVAQSALETEGATVADLANRLGYRSEAAFARAFKRVTGLPPGAVRRRAEAQADPGSALATVAAPA